jgi:hypothetical protein
MDTSKYFYRNVIFSKKLNQISLIDIYNPDTKKQVLEPWFGVVLQLADGQHTVDELFSLLSSKYKETLPTNLEKTIHSVIERLAKSNLIILTDKATELPYYLSRPYEYLDTEKAKKLLKKDRKQIVDIFKKNNF